MSIDLSQDWQLVEAPQTVQLFPRTAEDTYGDPIEVTDVNRVHTDTTVLGSDLGDFELRACEFDLWTAKLGEAVPKIGDVIADADGVRWNVKAVKQCDRDDNGVQRYHCSTLLEE